MKDIAGVFSLILKKRESSQTGSFGNLYVVAKEAFQQNYQDLQLNIDNLLNQSGIEINFLSRVPIGQPSFEI